MDPASTGVNQAAASFEQLAASISDQAKSSSLKEKGLMKGYQLTVGAESKASIPFEKAVSEMVSSFQSMSPEKQREKLGDLKKVLETVKHSPNCSKAQHRGAKILLKKNLPEIVDHLNTDAKTKAAQLEGASSKATQQIESHGWLISEENRTPEKLLTKLDALKGDIEQRIEKEMQKSGGKLNSVIDQLHIELGACNRTIEGLDKAIREHQSAFEISLKGSYGDEKSSLLSKLKKATNAFIKRAKNVKIKNIAQGLISKVATGNKSDSKIKTTPQTSPPIPDQPPPSIPKEGAPPIPDQPPPSLPKDGAPPIPDQPPPSLPKDGAPPIPNQPPPSLGATKKIAVQQAVRHPEIPVLAKAIEDVGKETGFAAMLDSFNQQTKVHGSDLKLKMSDVVVRTLVDDFKALAQSEGDKKGRSLSDEELSAVAQSFIKQNGILDRKLQQMKEIDTMNLTDRQKDYAKDAVIRNNYGSMKEFVQSYFHGVAPKELKTNVYGRKTAEEVDHTNASVQKTVTDLKGKKYDPATYNPRQFFDQIQVEKGPPSTSTKQWIINRAILEHFSSSLPPEQEEARTTLVQRGIGYLTKFANMNDPDKTGMQASPLVAGEKGYFRANVHGISKNVAAIVADSLGVDKNNLQLVTDGRVMEVVKRELGLVQGASVMAWDESNFNAIMDQLYKGDGKVFVDITEFMAATCRGHTDNPEELKTAIKVVGEFMLNTFEGALEDYVENNPKTPPINKEEFRNKLLNQLILGSVVNVGELSALYTCPLGIRTGSKGQEVFEESKFPEGSDESKLFTSIIAHNGFTVGPNHLIDSWLKSAPNSETVGRLVSLMTGTTEARVKLPEEISGLAEFENFNQFFSTDIFQQFEALGSKQGAPPYLEILTSTTIDLLKGLENENAMKKFEEAGLEPLLQLSLNKMQAIMQEAVDSQENLMAFSNQIQLIHAEISTILAVAQPLESAQFSTMMRGVTDMLPNNFPKEIQPEFQLKNSGMRCLASVLSGCEQLKLKTTGSERLNIAVQSDCYYESAINLSSAAPHKTHTLKGTQAESSAESIAANMKNPDGSPQKLDLYVCEFHHNISNVLKEYQAEDVIRQVDTLFEKGLVSDHFTVAIDITISLTDSAEIKEFLEHNKDRIASGELNVVFYRSAQKFDLMGMDSFNGGIMSTMNTDKYAAFNSTVKGGEEGLAKDSISRYNEQGIAFYQKYGQKGLNEYRAATMRAAGKLGSPQSDSNPVGLPVSMFANEENIGKAQLQIAPNTDKSAVFLDLRNPWMKPGSKEASDLYGNLQMFLVTIAQGNPKEFSIDSRPSFGFNHSNISLIGGEKFRFNPGMESDEGLMRYRDLLVNINGILEEAATDYHDPAVFNAINSSLTGPGVINFVYAMKQKEKMGAEVTVDERIKLASTYANAGNYKAARRELAKAESTGALSVQQLQAAEAARQLLSKEVTPSATVLKNNLRQQTAAVRDMLHEGRSDKFELLGALGKALDTASSLDKNPVTLMRRMLVQDFDRMSPAELEVFSKSAANAAKAYGDTTNPMRMMLSQLSSLAGQQAVINENKNPKEIQGENLASNISQDFLHRMDIRQRPSGSKDPSAQHMLGDFYSSIQYHTTPPQERKELSGGDRLVEINTKTPQGRLMGLYSGFYFQNTDKVMNLLKEAGSKPKIADATKAYLMDLPLNEASIPPQLPLSHLTSLLAQGAIRKQYISFNEILKQAEAGKEAGFQSAAEEFLKGSITSIRELEVAGKMFTDQKYLSNFAPGDREVLRSLGMQYLEIAQEMKHPRGLCNLMQQFVGYAKSDPQTYMPLLAAQKNNQ